MTWIEKRCAGVAVKRWLLFMAAGGLFFFLASHHSDHLRKAIELPIVGVLLAAAGVDLYCRRIPDWITLPGLAWAIGISLAPGLWRPTDALLGGLVGGGLLLIIAALSRGAIGGGDIKLMAVIGAMVGPGLGLAVLMIAHVVAAVIMLSRLIVGVQRWRDPVPFGPFLALAGIAVLLARS